MGINPRYRHAALSVAIAAVREHPALPLMFDSPDSAWRAVVAKLIKSDMVNAYLERMFKKPDALRDLLDDAAEHINHTEPKLIREHYRHHRAAGTYDALNGSQRLVLLAVLTQALRPDRHGGRRVVMSIRYMQTLIATQFGRRLNEKSLKNARHALVRRGLFEIKPGKPWSSGSPQSTQYVLPTPTETELYPLALPPETGLGDLGRDVRRRGWVELPEDIPVMTEQTVQALEHFRAGRRSDKRHRDLGISEPTEPATPPPAPAPEDSDWLLNLLAPEPVETATTEQETAMRTEPTAPEPSTLICPAGHAGDDIMYLQTARGSWWPACLRCLSTPVPGDAATWRADR